jgi:hypothetical protein
MTSLSAAPFLPIKEDATARASSIMLASNAIYQIIPGTEGKKTDTRFEGGFGIYDAPAPWGPWTTAFFTEKWDVGPGESASFPTKWMSADGKALHLVFSGDDYFAVRKATLRTSQ